LEHLRAFIGTLLSSLRDLTPIILVVAFFQIVVIRQPIPDYSDLVVGTLFVIFGLAFFIRGLEQALFPLGESVAYAFARKGNLAWLLIFAFALGFGTTIAEPALTAVSAEAAKIAAADGAIAGDKRSMASYALGLRLTVALSVGFAIVVGVFRILRGWHIQYVMISGYIGVVILTAFAPP
jgi:hypothetical protein